jgi:hypothetical protein
MLNFVRALLLVAVWAGGGCLARAAEGLLVAGDGKPLVSIALPSVPSPSTRYAGEELERHLSEISGTRIKLVEDAPGVPAGTVVIGRVDGSQAIINDIEVSSLGPEEYVIRSDRSRVVIAGGQPRGILYGVYGLLEDHLGCRWLTADVSHIPKDPDLVIPAMDERVVPRLEYREPFVMDCFDGDWAARNRMNSSAARLEARHGGKVTYFGFVHTFEGLVPPDVYFKEHPEYYSLVKGRRRRERSQLCCTNDEVVRIVTDEIRKRMREHPEAKVFSVSQNDWYNYCECDRCTALAESEGTQMAPVLSLVNQVAAAVADEFPEKLVDTLAYQYTRKAPKTMRPAPNVVVRLCSIECCFAHAFQDCDSPQNRAFVQDVQAWSQVGNRLWVWNYDTSFANYFMPYPNLRVRNDNIKFFADNNVTGIFEQDVYTTLHGELSELSGYLNAKLLWNPDYDENAAINEFLEGVYGAAARPIRQYIDLLHDHVETNKIHMDIWIGPDHPVLNDEILGQAERLWDEAERLVANDLARLERVRVARLSVDFAAIERTRGKGIAAYDYDPRAHSASLRPEFATRIDRFFDIATRHGVTNLREQGGALGTYRRELDGLREINSEPLRAGPAPAATEPGLKYRYYEGVWNSLPHFAALTPQREGIAERISPTPTGHAEAFGLVYEGFLQVSQSGLYAFTLQSNDGSRLTLGNRPLIDHDGMHQSTAKHQFVVLEKGLHPLRLEYFNAGGRYSMSLTYAGPGVRRQEVSAPALRYGL